MTWPFEEPTIPPVLSSGQALDAKQQEVFAASSGRDVRHFRFLAYQYASLNLECQWALTALVTAEVRFAAFHAQRNDWQNAWAAMRSATFVGSHVGVAFEDQALGELKKRAQML